MHFPAKILSLLSLLLLGSAAHAADITVFAAASLTDCLKEIAADYQAETYQKIYFNFGASSTLERQIEAGAPADIFFSADEAKMNKLQKQNLILPETRKSRLSNSLVIIIPDDSSLTMTSAADLTNSTIQRIALADPKAVPAGIYSKTYLQKLHLWPALEPKIIPTENVRAALAAVASGNVDAGMVYKTDAAISKKVKVAFEIPLDQGPNISYPMAVVKTSTQPAAAKSFLDYLATDKAASLFQRYGFIVRKQP